MSIDIQDPSRLPSDLSIFFCWQDHLPPKLHRFLIRDALHSAISIVQDELPDILECTLRIDEASAGRAGSVDIANTILQKLNSSAIVIGDVTPVLSNAKEGWFYPNPNVMFEIGYAARAIGWSRIICLYNKAEYKADQLPFDIRHRRVTAFSCSDLSQRKQAVNELKGILSGSIRAIVQEISRGEIDQTVGDETARHKRDLRFLREVLSTIHRPTLDSFIKRGQHFQLHYDCLFCWHYFDAVVGSCEFRFHDKKLQKLAYDLHRVWDDALTCGSSVFAPGSIPGSLVLKPDHLWDDEYRTIVTNMATAYLELPEVLNAFLDHVHDHFSEIDMVQTDKIAWKNMLPYIN